MELFVNAQGKLFAKGVALTLAIERDGTDRVVALSGELRARPFAARRRE